MLNMFFNETPVNFLLTKFYSCAINYRESLVGANMSCSEPVLKYVSGIQFSNNLDYILIAKTSCCDPVYFQYM